MALSIAKGMKSLLPWGFGGMGSRRDVLRERLVTDIRVIAVRERARSLHACMSGQRSAPGRDTATTSFVLGARGK